MNKSPQNITIAIQSSDFDQAQLYHNLRGSQETGAIVTFTGLVREFDQGCSAMHLEHYPGMTEQVLQNIAANAYKQWPLDAITVVHRVGALKPSEQIVFVGVASKHRQAAFEACHFIIDLLKTRAPFWKKEGDDWVKNKESDQKASQRWLELNA